MHGSDILNLGWKGALVVCLLATVNSPDAKEDVPKEAPVPLSVPIRLWKPWFQEVGI